MKYARTFKRKCKKIIEKEIFLFHAEAYFFPMQANVDSSKSFQLRTMSENLEDLTKKLQRGLNLIPVILKPVDNWKNWVWGLIGQGKLDLKVLIQVQLS